MNKGLIADIQRCSTHDGPGVRTTVFFKGCPLKCEWCHNPECIGFEPQMMFYPEKCINCGMCHKGCYAGARILCGKEYSTEELYAQILQDKPYYGLKGGVTFSGGEPFAQAGFLGEITDICKKKNIHCAVETSLIYFNEDILKKMDLVMADLKIWDNNLHKKYTGVDNTRIKEHFEMLDSLNIPIIMRTPVIEEINQEIDKISEFGKSLKNVIQYELLPYHPLGESKRIALGAQEKSFIVPSKAYMEEVGKYAFIR